MLKHVTILAVFLVTLSATGVAADGNFSVSLDPDNQDVDLGSSATYTVSVTNTGTEERRYLFSAVSLSSWTVSPRSLTLNPGETGEVSLTVAVPDDVGLQAGQHGFFVTVYPENVPDRQQQVTGTLTIQRKHELVVTNIQTGTYQYQPGSTATVKATVKNVKNQDAAGYTLDLLFAGETTKVSVPTVSPGSSITLDKQLRIGDHLVGSHTVTAQLVDGTGEKQHANQITIDIAQVRNVDTATEKENLALWKTQETTVRNTGNVPADKTVTLSVPGVMRWLTTATPEPDTVTTEGGSAQYRWSFTGLPPGATKTVSTRVNYWAIYLFLLALLLAGAAVYRYVYAVTVEKHVFKDGDRYTVHVYVKNDTFRDVPQLTVEDHLPGIAALVKEYETREPDTLRQTEDGAELGWDVSMLHSGEERVFTYRIKPKVQVEGDVQLPPAKVTYETHGRSLTRLSNKVDTVFAR